MQAAAAATPPERRRGTAEEGLAKRELDRNTNNEMWTRDVAIRAWQAHARHPTTAYKTHTLALALSCHYHLFSQICVFFVRLIFFWSCRSP